MCILSIDVGTKNLAMCVLGHSNVIMNWEVSGVPTEGSTGLYECLFRHLEERPWVLEGTQTILIERQPEKNRRMKSVENFLHAYFICKGKETILWDAKHKVPDVVGPGKAQYRKRKQTAVTRCHEFLKETKSAFLETFENSKKKDDLADSLLQALSFTPPKIDQKKKTPRKPTVRQLDVKFSPANLAWFVKNNTTHKRFESDLKRYYTNISELIKDFDL
jgi:hypothetical protein